jgi:PKD repeat protein
VAGFEAAPGAGPAPLEVAFSDRSSGAVTAWSWDFGDGTGSGAAAPRHVYAQPGRYTVMLTVSGPGGSDSLVQADLVQVQQPAPVAGFECSPGQGPAPLTVTFSDRSSGPISVWSWDFGDGTGSDQASPVHEYGAVGVYGVTLTVTGPGGSDSLQVPDLVQVTEPPPVASFSGSPRTGRAPLAVQFRDLSRGAITGWEWDFGDGTGSLAREPVHVYRTPGTYTVRLRVRSAGGIDGLRRDDYLRVEQPLGGERQPAGGAPAGGGRVPGP